MPLWCVIWAAGLCYELCAGIMDKPRKTPAEVCRRAPAHDNRAGQATQPLSLLLARLVLQGCGVLHASSAGWPALEVQSCRLIAKQGCANMYQG